MVTEVHTFNEKLIKEAIETELAWGGQEKQRFCSPKKLYQTTTIIYTLYFRPIQVYSNPSRTISSGS